MVQTIVNIGSLITSMPNIQAGKPMIAGTGTTVHRIAMLYKQGYTPDEIAADKDYLMLAQVYAALAYYYANQDAIETDRAEDIAEYDRLAQQASSIISGTS